MKEMLKRWPFYAAAVLIVLLCIPQFAHAGTLTVLTVPEDPSSPATPHTTYPTATIVLGATAPGTQGSTDTFNVVWVFGDGSANATFSYTGTATTAPYAYDISTTHVYSGGAGTTWTATVTVTDANNGNTGTAQYFVIMEANTLPSRVDVAIDWGLWYMHQTMWRKTTGAGGWDTDNGTCNNVTGAAYDCGGNMVINAENVQAFEVSGHTATGPATDPFTDDVIRGQAEMFLGLTNQANISNTYQYNPAPVNYRCSTSTPGLTVNPMVTSTASQGSTTYPYCPTNPASSQVFFNSGATSCTSPPCSFTFDGNSNGQLVFSSDGNTIYTTGPYMDALVASGTPSAIAPTGTAAGGGLPGIKGQTFKNIVQDMADWYAACQYEFDYDLGNPAVSNGYFRGYGGTVSGGGWRYVCQQAAENSTSQWAAIGLIGANRGFGIPVPAVVTDMNNVWVTNSQANETGDFPGGTDPWAAGKLDGSFGYAGDSYQSTPWSSFAVTPSGGVQMAMDGIGRTTNTVFGDGSTGADQRWNNYETYYADNFCNNVSGGATSAPLAYTYGMFSFTKSMLLHDPGGVLTPIQFLRTETPGVFTTNASVPANSIDWYAALSPANGGTDPCDGIAQTLVSYQSPDGHWYGHDYDQGYQSVQSQFETAWSIIMLRKTVFVSCVSNLYGRGTPGSGRTTARIDLSWGAQTGATSYNVLRGTANGGPYTLIGNTVTPVFSDRSASLVNGSTYYYVVQPLQGQTEICQSNQETVTIPNR